MRLSNARYPAQVCRKKRGNRGSSKQSCGATEWLRNVIKLLHRVMLLANGVQDINKSDDGEIGKCKYPPSKIALLDERTLSGATAPRPSADLRHDGTERVNARAVIKRATRPSGTEWRARAEGKTVTQKTISGRQSHLRYR